MREHMTVAAIKSTHPGFVIDRQGKDFVTYVGLLDAAHRAGLVSIHTTLLQAPSKENEYTTIVHAQVTMKDGDVYSGIGDATPRNVGTAIAPHAIRMAETRAKGRALRDALNIGGAALEELGPEADDTPARQPAPAPEQTYRAPASTPEPPPTATEKPQRYTSALPDSPASRIQKDRMVKLLGQLDRPVDQGLLDAMTAGQAEQQIAALARAFNERSRTGRTPPVEQRTDIFDDADFEAVFPTSGRR